MPLDDLSFAAIAKQLNTRFRVETAPGAHVDMELIEAELAPEMVWPAGPKGAENVRYERFSLVFTGPREPALEQRIYAFEHDGIGRFEIFITPILSRDQTRIYYEAVFNRPLKISA